MAIDTEALKARTDIVSVIGHYVSLAKKGSEYVARCPFHSPDEHPSFYVVPAKRIYHCFSCGASGDVIDFVREYEGCDFKAAVEKLTGEEIDWKPRTPIKHAAKPRPERATSKPPPDAPMPDMATRSLGEPQAVYPILDVDGAMLGFEARYKGENGKKEVRIWSWGSRGDDPPGWGMGHFTPPRPLFGLPRLQLQPQHPVSIFEGPKKAEAGAKLIGHLYACVSWTGGANAWHRHDLEPLRGRGILIWPDADEPGWEAAAKLAAVLADPAGLACKVRIVDTHGMDPGWDIANALEAGWTSEQLIEWAKPRASDYTVSGPAPDVDASSDVAPSAATPDAAPPSDEPPPVEAYADEQRKPRKPRLAVVQGNTVLQPDERELPQEFSEDHLADEFANRHAEDWRYVKRWDKWYKWDGGGWVEDDTSEVFHLARALCRSAAYWPGSAQLTPNGKRALGNKRLAGNVRDIAGTDRRIAATADQWDRDPWLLGVPSGVIDLRTGKLVEAEREHYITKRTSVTPTRGPHERWDRIIARATRGDATMQHYLQKWAGYMLTGDTREEAFLFVHGPGGSGKSTFVQVLRDCLGTYAKATRIETFMSTRHGEHPTEIADLAGARLVSAPETEEGSRWNEGRIKMLTGRDKVKARFMGQDYFEFEPVCKIMIFGNHRPRLHSVGEEMKRRIHLVEFPDSIPQEERDPALKLAIRDEYPAILQWMIDGCIAWQQEGLGRPEQVSAATDDYLSSQDTLGAWMDDCCTKHPDMRCQVSAAYRSFEQWAKERGEYVPSVTVFSEKMQSRGIEKRKASTMQFLGIGLKESAQQAPRASYVD